MLVLSDLIEQESLHGKCLTRALSYLRLCLDPSSDRDCESSLPVISAQQHCSTITKRIITDAFDLYLSAKGTYQLCTYQLITIYI